MNFVVVWGTKIRRKKLGWVADYCPICHEFRPFAIHRVGEARHIYYVAFGQGKLLGHEIRCESCGITLDAELQEYRTISRDALGSADELAEETTPDLKERYAERLEAERSARSPGGKPDLRIQFLLEPFFSSTPWWRSVPPPPTSTRGAASAV